MGTFRDRNGAGHQRPQGAGVGGNGHRGRGTKKRFMKDPMGVQQVLNLALKQFGLDDELARYTFVLKCNEIVSAEIASRTKPECIKNARLVVRVTDSMWAQELSFQKDVILRRLQRHLQHGEEVRDILFYVAG